MRRSRGAARPRPSSTSRFPAPRAPRPSAAEVALLGVAQALARISRDEADERGSVAAMRAVLEEAFGPRAALPRQLVQAWLRTRGDKTAALALGWAREQVRRALVDLWHREGQRGGPMPAIPAEVAAWVILAVVEAEAHEPGGAIGDRLGVVCSLLGLGERGDAPPNPAVTPAAP